MPPTNQSATTTKPDVATALNTQRQAIEEKLGALRANPTPEIKALLREADKAVADFRQLTQTLEASLSEIDAQLGQRERDRRSAAEEQRRQELAASREQLVVAVEAELDSIGRAQGHLRAFVSALNETFSKHGEVLAVAVKISNGARLPSGFSQSEFVSRITGGLAATLAEIKVPGAYPGVSQRVGSIVLPTHSLYRASEVWRAREESKLMPSVQQLVSDQPTKVR